VPSSVTVMLAERSPLLKSTTRLTAFSLTT
jgi:hypothetical protein